MRIRSSRDDWPDRGDVPAPVITEHGAWGTPPPSASEPPGREGEVRVWTTVALALVLAVWLSALSLSQLTSRAVAIPVAERGIAAVAEVDSLLALHELELCAAAATGGDQAVDLAGFPVYDVLLRADEVQCPGGVLDREALRSLLLGRAAELLYLRGSAAFTDPSRAADDSPLLSSSWAIRLMLDSVGSGLHGWVSMAAWGAGGLAVLGTALLLMAGGRRSRVGRLGWAMALGAAPVVAGAGAAWLALTAFAAGLEGGSMLREFAEIARTLAALPARNGLLLLAAGLALVLPALWRRG